MVPKFVKYSHVFLVSVVVSLGNIRMYRTFVKMAQISQSESTKYLNSMLWIVWAVI